ncbi:MAG: hypothetical protein ABI361_02495 [Nitrososphaera sp.]|jgi:hypothetical protein
MANSDTDFALQNRMSASNQARPSKSPHMIIDNHTRRRIELYLAARISELDRDIVSNLHSRKPDYEWGKRMGRMLECKRMLEWLDASKNHSVTAMGASIVE